ncbi:MAG: VOC family protein [Zoogloeaceae bacterium]|nr:VOC family protein [Zoogloeaceae bacterium]
MTRRAVTKARAEPGQLQGIHHVALIRSDYARSRRFYVDTLALRILAENFREQRQSWKLDLALPDGTQLELFSFPDPPARASRSEACGLRHLAFAVDEIDAWKARLEASGIAVEEIRIDEFTGRRFAFLADPDGLPLELYETAQPATRTSTQEHPRWHFIPG